jgi:hypothetical protein
MTWRSETWMSTSGSRILLWHYMSWWPVARNAIAWADHLIIELKFALGKIHFHEIADKNSTRNNKNDFYLVLKYTLSLVNSVDLLWGTSTTKLWRSRYERAGVPRCQHRTVQCSPCRVVGFAISRLETLYIIEDLQSRKDWSSLEEPSRELLEVEVCRVFGSGNAI